MSPMIRAPVGVLDHFCPPNYTAFGWYIPLKDGVAPQDAFATLRHGLRLTFKQLPWLSGKVYKKAPSTPGWRPGELEIGYDLADLEGDIPQFRFKQFDESHIPMSYDEIRDCAFPLDTFADDEILWGTYIKVPEEDEGAECFKAQANFIPGGLLLCGATHHNVSDGTGQFDVWRLWAANCSGLQSGATPEVVDPLSSDHTLIERIWAAESTPKESKDINPVSWNLLDMDPPTAPPRPTAIPTLFSEDAMRSVIFYMSPNDFTALHKKCVREAGLEARISGNDALTALVWRGLLKARRTAALNSGRASASDLADVKAKLHLTLDGRPDISQRGDMPLVYLGNVVYMNLCTLPLSTLTAPDGLAAVAKAIRQTAEAATSETMLDAYGLAREVEDLATLGMRLAPLRHYDMMLSSLIMFPVEGMRWGGELFARGGEPDAVRPLLDEINKVARLCFPLPRRKAAAGVEFVLNLFDDEMELLMGDPEFSEFAVYLSS
ncbi:hypothetical protein B0I37DRAFT_395567 [Chaetomium sp. MPI-CAGE-AT-0009]|nr:hypothetical protein B0I37DRAFT_395567 [Chaetomium sp. MPI-CAGE-AT-0009]